jgi:tetratricopeptide (TPR) repeat protein
MRRVLLPMVVLALALAGPMAAQDWKGYGRIEGRVLDAAGEPVARVKVKLNLPERRSGGPLATTDAKGRWAVAGIAAGAWEIDYEADGYATLKARVNLPSESARLLPLVVRMSKGEAAVPTEVADALGAAEGAEKAGRLPEARAGYETLIALRPEVAAIAHQRIGATYIQEKQYGLALDHFQKALDADPGNATVRLIMAQAAFEGGLPERGIALVSAIDLAGIQNPDVAYNLGVRLLNAGRPADAATFFSRSIALDASYVDGYFRRGLAEINLGKVAEAKADLLKVLDLAPSGPQAELARKAVEQLK